jgi:hypothetical protein
MSHDVLPSIDVDIQCSIDYILILYRPFILVFVNNAFVHIFDPANYRTDVSEIPFCLNTMLSTLSRRSLSECLSAPTSDV